MHTFHNQTLKYQTIISINCSAYVQLKFSILKWLSNSNKTHSPPPGNWNAKFSSLPSHAPSTVWSGFKISVLSHIQLCCTSKCGPTPLAAMESLCIYDDKGRTQTLFHSIETNEILTATQVKGCLERSSSPMSRSDTESLFSTYNNFARITLKIRRSLLCQSSLAPSCLEPTVTAQFSFSCQPTSCRCK